MKKILLFLIFFCCNSICAATTIKFATDANYPPFEYIDESGTIKGFDIELAQALCVQMAATCTFTNQTFSSLLTSLNLGKFDAIISAMAITPERLKQVSFTTSYYVPSASFVGAIGSTTEIVGKKIGVQQGTTMEKYIREIYANKVTLKTYAGMQEAFLDLISGRIDFVLADLPIAQAWLKQNNNDKRYAIIGKPIIDPTFFGMGYGIAVRKNNVELLKALNQALADLHANGSYTKLYKKYF